METIVLGGGCFWCTEAVFKELRGIHSVTPGYAGGTSKSPSYEEVCSGKTGHAQVIRVEFDPKVISLKDILTVFFATHDPTSLNRQGNDVGTQYRSIVLCTDGAQKDAVEEYVANLKKKQNIVTEIKMLDTFYEAEGYHKEYYERNTTQPYCQIIIAPKLRHLKEEFSKIIKDKGPA